MSTTPRFRAARLAAADRQPAAPTSRTPYVVRALEHAVATANGWTAGLPAELTAARSDRLGRRAMEELRASIAARRTRKDPPAL